MKRLNEVMISFFEKQHTTLWFLLLSFIFLVPYHFYVGSIVSFYSDSIYILFQFLLCIYFFNYNIFAQENKNLNLLNTPFYFAMVCSFIVLAVFNIPYLFFVINNPEFGTFGYSFFNLSLSSSMFAYVFSYNSCFKANLNNIHFLQRREIASVFDEIV